MSNYSEIKYELKIFRSPIKWMICAFFIIIIPFIFYAPSTIDILNLWEIYVPLVSIVLLSDIMMTEKANHTSEIVYLKTRRRTFSFMLRYCTSLILLTCFIALAVWIDGVFLGNVLVVEKITFVSVWLIVVPGSIFFGTLGLTVSNLFSSVPLGYLTSLVYWAYWMIGENMSRINVFNPFKFANGYEYLDSKYVLLLVTLLLIIVNGWIIERSPLKTQIRFKKKSV